MFWLKQPYQKKSYKLKGVEREMFIDHQYIEGLLEKAKDAHDEDILYV